MAGYTSLQLATIHAFVLAVCALVYFRRWLKATTAPFIKGLPFPAHLHLPFLGIAHLMEDMIEGTRVVAVKASNESGIVTFKLMGTPAVSVLKAEHVRKVQRRAPTVPRPTVPHPTSPHRVPSHRALPHRVCKVLLASNFRHRIPLLQKHMETFLGPKALVLLMHDEWKLHRRMMTKAFHWQSLQGMVPDIVNVSSAFAKLLQRRGAGGEPIDMFRALKLATLDTIGLTAFGFEFNTVRDGAHPVAAAFEYLLDETTRRQFTSPLSPSALFTWLPTPANRRLWKEVKVIRSTIDAIVSARMQGTGNHQHEDLLKYMAESKEASTLSPQAFADNLLTFLFGGFDTTSITLAYTTFLLAKHPHEQKECVDEVIKVVGKHGDITHDSVTSLKRCQAVLSEALRLYPPAPLTTRTLETELELDGHVLPAGTMCWVPIWWIQRSALNWGDDANDFRPARFLDDNRTDDGSEPPTSAAKASGASALRTLAFSGGQRNCVGQRFAMLEATIMLAILVRECEFKLPAGHPEPMAVSAGVVQKPKEGIHLLVEKRA